MIKNNGKYILNIIHYDDIGLNKEIEKVVGEKSNGSGECNFNGLIDCSGAKYIFWNFETSKKAEDIVDKLKKNKELIKKLHISIVKGK